MIIPTPGLPNALTDRDTHSVRVAAFGSASADDYDAAEPDDEPRSVRAPLVTRGAEPDYDPDPAVWLAANRMTRTEASLRLARYLLAERRVASDVAVSLTGHELTRRERPRFPVVRYLAERDVVHRDRTDDWRGTYLMKGATHALWLHSESAGADVVATLASGRHFVGHVSAGLLDASRSPAEHTQLRSALARAFTYELAEPDDLAAAVVPRSTRFRALAVRWRAALGVSRAGILILTVDRAGAVGGLPADRPL